MDYVKQGVDQLGQAAGKVKEAVSNATSTVVDAVTGDNRASTFNESHVNSIREYFFVDQNIDEAKRHGESSLIRIDQHGKETCSSR